MPGWSCADLTPEEGETAQDEPQTFSCTLRLPGLEANKLNATAIEKHPKTTKQKTAKQTNKQK